MYGPVRTVVWEGGGREAPPYPDECLPKSPWGQAVHYSLQRWEKLCRYVDDGRIEIDNNRVENAIRPIALAQLRHFGNPPLPQGG